jgi:hypothetical protein
VIEESCAIAGAPTAIARTNPGQAETISFRSKFIPFAGRDERRLRVEKYLTHYTRERPESE